MGMESKQKQLISKVMEEIRTSLSRESIKKNKLPVTETKKDPTPTIQSVLERWSSRNKNTTPDDDASHVSLTDLDRSNTILITGGIKTSDNKTISSFDTVYPIIDDFLYPKPQGTGTYLVSIECSKFIHNITGNLTVYLGTFTNKAKLCKKVWNHGDLRSHNSIDFSYYKDVFDPSTGRIPGIAVAAALWLSKTNPEKNVVIYGFNLADFSAWDQTLIKQHHLRLCM